MKKHFWAAMAILTLGALMHGARAVSGPTITSQSSSQTVAAGQTAIFAVTATGTGTLSYQWRRGGSNVGGNSSIYVIAAASPGDAGDYDCVVTDDSGTTTSSPTIPLTVNALTPGVTYQLLAGFNDLDVANDNFAALSVNNVTAPTASGLANTTGQERSVAVRPANVGGDGKPLLAYVARGSTSIADGRPGGAIGIAVLALTDLTSSFNSASATARSNFIDTGIIKGDASLTIGFVQDLKYDPVTDKIWIVDGSGTQPFVWSINGGTLGGAGTFAGGVIGRTGNTNTSGTGVATALAAPSGVVRHFQVSNVGAPAPGSGRGIAVRSVNTGGSTITTTIALAMGLYLRVHRGTSTDGGATYTWAPVYFTLGIPNGDTIAGRNVASAVNAAGIDDLGQIYINGGGSSPARIWRFPADLPAGAASPLDVDDRALGGTNGGTADKCGIPVVFKAPVGPLTVSGTGTNTALPSAITFWSDGTNRGLFQSGGPSASTRNVARLLIESDGVSSGGYPYASAVIEDGYGMGASTAAGVQDTVLKTLQLKVNSGTAPPVTQPSGPTNGLMHTQFVSSGSDGVGTLYGLGFVIDGKAYANVSPSKTQTIPHSTAMQIAVGALGPQLNISGVTVTQTSTTTANISWTTDQASTQRVQSGVTAPKYGTFSDIDQATRTTSHSITLTGLVVGTPRYFRLLDWAPGYKTASYDGFITPAAPVAVNSVTFNPAAAAVGQQTTITVTVTPGTNPVVSVTADLSPIGGSATQALSNGGSGNIYTYVATVGSGVPGGVKTINAVATDAVDGLTGTGSGTLTVYNATQLVFTTQPQGGVKGFTLKTQPVVTVEAANGDPTTNYSGPITITLKPGSGTPGATLSGTTTINAVGGVATFTDLVIDLPGSGYILTATAPDLSLSGDSAAFAVGNTPTGPWGDVDQDGFVTVADAELANTYITSPGTLTVEQRERIKRYGDINGTQNVSSVGDSVVDMNDLLRMARIAGGILDPGTAGPQYPNYGDVDNDGKVTMQDVVRLARYLNGLETNAGVVTRITTPGIGDIAPTTQKVTFGDGVIDAADESLIRQRAIGTEANPPAYQDYWPMIPGDAYKFTDLNEKSGDALFQTNFATSSGANPLAYSFEPRGYTVTEVVGDDASPSLAGVFKGINGSIYALYAQFPYFSAQRMDFQSPMKVLDVTQLTPGASWTGDLTSKLSSLGQLRPVHYKVTVLRVGDTFTPAAGDYDASTPVFSTWSKTVSVRIDIAVLAGIGSPMEMQQAVFFDFAPGIGPVRRGQAAIQGAAAPTNDKPLLELDKTTVRGIMYDQTNPTF